MIDMRTIITSYAVTNLICASLMALLWLQNRRRFSGIGFWVGHYLAVCTGVILIALRGLIPDLISIVFANTLLILGLILVFIGLQKCIGYAGSQVHNYILLAVFIFIHSWFTYIHPSLLARNINVSAAIFIGAVQIAWFIFRKAGAVSSVNMRGLGVIFLSYCLISVARITADLLIDPGTDFLRSGTDSLAFLAYQSLQVALTLNLFLQVNRRLVVDLERDNLQRQQTEKALTESESRYRAVTHSANDAIISANGEGHIIGWNRGAEALFGYSEVETLDQPLTTLMPSRFRERHLAGLERAQSGGEKRIIGKTVEVQGRRKDETEFPLEMSLAEWQVGEARFYTAIIRDISERRQAEETLQQTQMQIVEQQRTLATLEERERVARELHDGIGQVLGYVNVQTQAAQALLEKNQLDAAQKNLGEIIHVAQDAHANLRHTILGLRDSVVPQRDFYQALRAYLNSFRQAWGIETIFSPPQEDLPAIPAAVEDQLLHIIQEALVNVRKHAHAQRVEVLVSQGQGEMTLIVSDNGRGFNPQNAQGAEKEHFGLSIMRERAEQVGGRLEMRSEVGRGTQVFVHVPVLPTPAPNQKDAYGLRILLVDDQPLFLDGMRNLLTARGLTIVGTAHDGLEALAQVRSLRPDIVLMDVEMPKCDGVESTRLIKTEFPEIKVVLLTVSEDDENLLRAIQFGASNYLLKSLDAAQLLSTLDGLARGEIQIAPGMVARLLKDFNRAGEAARPGTETIPAELSMRQWEVLRLAARGLTYKEVGRELHLSEPTIKYHMTQILDRLQLKNREQAVAYLREVEESRRRKRG